MNWNTILLVAIAYSCGSTFWRSIRRQPAARGWVIASGLVLILTAAVAVRWPDSAGYVGAVAWAILLILPWTLLNLANRAAMAGRLNIASILSQAASLLHPADGVPEQYALHRAVRLLAYRQQKKAVDLLLHVQGSHTSSSMPAQVRLMALQSRWHELAEWFAISMGPDALIDYPILAPIFLRSLGETGDLPSLLTTFRQIQPDLNELPARRILDRCRLIVLAFTGQTLALRSLLGHRIKGLSPDAQDFWLATAYQAAAQRDDAQSILLALTASPEAEIAHSAKLRLDHPLPPAVPALGQSDLRFLATSELLQSPPRRLPWATYALILANAIVFAVEYFRGGTRDDDVLWSMGALDPETFNIHRWWTVIAANFLHYGWEHILMNMLALYILGPFVEFAWGWLKYITLYLLFGVGAMLVVLLLERCRLIELGTVVGASGAIMALIGAIAAILLRDWLRLRVHYQKRRLFNVLWIVVLQVILDRLSPMVSSTAHLAGVTLGFAVAMIVPYRSDQVPRVLP